MCVTGSGGRAHALALALGRTADVVVCPGNAGMAALGVACVPGSPEDVDADLFVIGPEEPLVGGLADRLRAAGRLVFGPGADGARLEGSKAWMKDVLAGAGVPTAAYGIFDEVGPAAEFLRSLPGPWVVKTDGLAAGKGVLVTADMEKPIADARAKLSGATFGGAGRRVVIEEGLTGSELSVMAICDGVRARVLVAAQDFKRAGDGDTGPNTGGMGAYSPVPAASEAVVDEVHGPRHRSHPGRPGRSRHRLPGCPLRRPDADSSGTADPGVQCSLWRSRGPGRLAPLARRHHRGAGRRRRRAARYGGRSGVLRG